MEKKLSEYVNDCDMIIVGIGSEWDWIRRGLKSDSRYSDLLEYCKDEQNEWLLPILEFEYGYYNNDATIDDAYKKLRDIIGDKDYFLVADIFLQDALLNGFDSEKCVFPCGNYRYLQSGNADDPLIDVTKCEDFQGIINRIHRMIEGRNGVLMEGEGFYKPFFDGKTLYLNQKRQEYSKIKYNESSYLDNWDKYTKYLSSTMGKNLLMLELGVSLDYPTVIRWPFEKVAFVNNKAHLIRVHEKLYHHTPEIKDKTDSIQMNSVNYILQES
jgi:hypothetical protein